MNTTPTLDKDFSAALRAELVGLAGSSTTSEQGSGSGATVTEIRARRRGRSMRFALVAASVAAGLMIAPLAAARQRPRLRRLVRHAHPVDR